MPTVGALISFILSTSSRTWEKFKTSKFLQIPQHLSFWLNPSDLSISFIFPKSHPFSIILTHFIKSTQKQHLRNYFLFYFKITKLITFYKTTSHLVVKLIIFHRFLHNNIIFSSTHSNSIHFIIFSQIFTFFLKIIYFTLFS